MFSCALLIITKILLHILLTICYRSLFYALNSLIAPCLCANLKGGHVYRSCITFFGIFPLFASMYIICDTVLFGDAICSIFIQWRNLIKEITIVLQQQRSPTN